jgi:ubiquinone/menaquinone biosynthesis C-methylase UbiE
VKDTLRTSIRAVLMPTPTTRLRRVARVDALDMKSCAGESFQALPSANPFEHIAGIYDTMSRLISFGLIRVWRKRAARGLTVSAGEVALDLGTGTADFAIELTRISEASAHIIGIDLTPEMLVQAQQKVHSLGLEARIELRVGNGEQLDLPDNSVDLCCSSFLVRTLTDLEQGLREMWLTSRRSDLLPGGEPPIGLPLTHAVP